MLSEPAPRDANGPGGPGGAAAVDAGPACNNRCFACPRPAPQGAPDPAPDPPTDLHLPAGDGAVVLHGGEPTLHPALEALIAQARDSNRPLALDTNARAFAVEGRAARLRLAGLSHAVLTLHGAREASHDFLTRTPGSFRQMVAGAARLRAAGVRLTARALVTRSTVAELPQMATLALGLGAQALRIAWARMDPRPGMEDLAARSAEPRSDAKGVLRVDPETPAGDRGGYDQGREWLVPRFAAAADALAAAVGAAVKTRRTVALEGVPACLAPPGAAAVAAAASCYAPPVARVVRDAFAEVCAGCAERTRCPGVPAGYLARFGAGELVPRGAAGG